MTVEGWKSRAMLDRRGKTNNGRVPGGVLATELRGPAVTAISVTCRAGHRDQSVAFFEYRPEDAWGERWRFRQGSSGRNPNLARMPRPGIDTQEVYVNDRGEVVKPQADRRGVHLTFVLPCSKCGDKVDVRAERLYPVLDKLAEHGQPSIELSTLRRAMAACYRDGETQP